MSSDPLDDIKIVFFQECAELLEELEDGFFAMRDGSHTEETINAVFRAVHSIKGGAGAFGLDDTVRLAHQFETVLDLVRSNQLQPDDDLITLSLKAADQLSDLIKAAQDNAPSNVSGLEDSIAALALYENPAVSGFDQPVQETPDPTGFEPTPLEFDVTPLDLDFGDEDEDDEVGPWLLRFTPQADLYARGNDCCRLIGILLEMGATHVTLNLEENATWAEWAPETPVLEWRMALPTHLDETEIREVFEFVEDDCIVSLDRATEGVEGAQDAESEAQEAVFEPLKLDISIEMQEEVDQPTPPQPDLPSNPPTVSATPAASATASVVSAASNAAKATEAKTETSSTIRVELNRVDRLINLIGELVINQSMLAQGFQSISEPVSQQLTDGLSDLRQLTRDIQDSVMAIRAQPIKPLFRRMSRIVREAGEETGKQVQLVTEGEATEIDKTIIERLADPLTHMIRNAVDHGLETPERRAASGKAELGTVRLTAIHRSGRVVIEVADDGAGVNRQKVRQIAEEKGLVSESAELSDTEIDNLLFMPGFSTADSVSNLSGRGVGMDVVKRSIQNLGGRVSLASESGVGSVFTISLPLTLAVTDGMIVQVDDQLMVVSMSEIIETIRPSANAIQALSPTQNVILVRGEYVPVIDVGFELGFRPRLENPESGVVLLSETEAGERSALLLDGILDQRQVVIKGLEDNYGEVPGVAAVTILGDGNIALILDVDGLLRLSERRRIACAA